MNKRYFERITTFRAARSLAVIEHTVSAAALRAPCAASQISIYFRG